MKRSDQLRKVALELFTQKKYQEALSLYQQELAIIEEICGAEHSYTADRLRWLGFMHMSCGQNEPALLPFQRALAIREKIYGPEHVDTLDSINYLAHAYLNLKQYDKALPLCQRELEFNEKVHGLEHANTMRSIEMLASVYENLDQYEMMLPLFQRAFAISGVDSAPAAMLFKLAAKLERLGQTNQAQNIYVRAHCRAYGEALDLGSEAELFETFGQTSEALSICKEAMERCAKIDIAGNSKIVAALEKFGAILRRLSQTEDASNNPEAAETLLKLGAEFEKHGQSGQAQEMFSCGAVILDKLARAS